MKRLKSRVFVLALVGLASSVVVAQDKPDNPKVDLKKMKATIERLEKPVILELFQTRLIDALKLMEELAGVKLGSDYEKLPEKLVNVSPKEKPLGEALQELLNNISFTYGVRPDGDVFLQPVTTPKKLK